MCLRHVLGMAVCLAGLPRLERCAAVGTPLTLLAVLDDRQIAAKPSLIPAHEPADQVTALGRAVRRRDIPTLKEAKAAEREAAGAAAEVSKEGECSRRWCWGRGMVRYWPQVDGPGGCLACGSLAACTSALLCAEAVSTAWPVRLGVTSAKCR